MREMNRRRFSSRRVSGSAAALLVAVTAVAFSVPEHGADAAPAGPAIGVRAEGFGTGMRITFSRPGTLPFDPLMDVPIATSLGILNDTTGENRGFASIAYPGAAVAYPAGLVGLVGFPIAGEVLPSEHPISQLYGEIPKFLVPWPLMANANFPGSSGRRVDLVTSALRIAPVPLPVQFTAGAQESFAQDGFVSSSVKGLSGGIPSPFVLVPGLEGALGAVNSALQAIGREPRDLAGNSLAFTGMSSRFLATRSAAVADVVAETRVDKISLAGGLVELADVHSLAAARGDSRGARTNDAVNSIGLLSVLGVKVAIGDDGGLRVADTAIPADMAAPLADQLKELLDDAGVVIRTPSRATSPSGGSTQIASIAFRVADQAGTATVVTLQLSDSAVSLETYEAETVGTIGGDGFDPTFGPSEGDGAEVVDGSRGGAADASQIGGAAAVAPVGDTTGSISDVGGDPLDVGRRGWPGPGASSGAGDLAEVATAALGQPSGTYAKAPETGRLIPRAAGSGPDGQAQLIGTYAAAVRIERFYSRAAWAAGSAVLLLLLFSIRAGAAARRTSRGGVG